MGLFSRKGSLNGTSSPKSPKLNSQSSRSTMNSPVTPSFPQKPVVRLPPPPNPQLDPERYLTSLQAVRERSQLVYDKVQQGNGKCFTLGPTAMEDVIRYVVGIIKVFHDVNGMTCREIMIPHIQIFPLMGVGNISTLEADNDLNSSLLLGEIFHGKNVRVDYWIFSLCLYSLTLGQAMYGSSQRKRVKSTGVVKVSR